MQAPETLHTEATDPLKNAHNLFGLSSSAEHAPSGSETSTLPPTSAGRDRLFHLKHRPSSSVCVSPSHFRRPGVPSSSAVNRCRVGFLGWLATKLHCVAATTAASQMSASRHGTQQAHWVTEPGYEGPELASPRARIDRGGNCHRDPATGILDGESQKVHPQNELPIL